MDRQLIGEFLRKLGGREGANQKAVDDGADVANKQIRGHKAAAAWLLYVVLCTYSGAAYADISMGQGEPRPSDCCLMEARPGGGALTNNQLEKAHAWILSALTHFAIQLAQAQ
jgi:hypothetical protein